MARNAIFFLIVYTQSFLFLYTQIYLWLILVREVKRMSLLPDYTLTFTTYKILLHYKNQFENYSCKKFIRSLTQLQTLLREKSAKK